jgi:hypothetical protein
VRLRGLLLRRRSTCSAAALHRASPTCAAATTPSLDSPSVQALRDPRCVPGRVLPPIYCVGPLVIGNNGTSAAAADQERAMRRWRHECLAWLDAQPEKSVVFLYFRSRCVHLAEKLRGIATGLYRSAQRFLWALQSADAAGRHRGTDNDSTRSFKRGSWRGPRTGASSTRQTPRRLLDLRHLRLHAHRRGAVSTPSQLRADARTPLL